MSNFCVLTFIFENVIKETDLKNKKEELNVKFFKDKLRLNHNSGCSRYCGYFAENNFRQRKFRKEKKMPVICNWPGCGYVFPQGQKVSDRCPNCDGNPFKIVNPETRKPFTYTVEEVLGKKIILKKAAR